MTDGELLEAVLRDLALGALRGRASVVNHREAALLVEEIRRLRTLCRGLADRVASQSELLTRRSESGSS